MRDGLIAVNGKVYTSETAVISPLDRGLLFADDLSEVLVAFGPTILNLPRHLERLRGAAETLDLPIPWSDAELGFELSGLVEQLAAPKTYLRLTVTRGNGLGVRPPAEPAPTRIAYCFPAAAEAAGVYADGVALKRTVRGGVQRGPWPKTSGNYLPSITALPKAAQEGFDDLLWTNGEGELTEASASNIFFMARDGDQISFLTPSVQSGILPGITRATMMTLLQQAKIPVAEQIIFADEIPRFDEAFLCSSVRGLVPVKAIGKHRLHTARPTAVFRHIERLFLTWAETQLGHRVDWGTGRIVPSAARS